MSGSDLGACDLEASSKLPLGSIDEEALRRAAEVAADAVLSPYCGLSERLEQFKDIVDAQNLSNEERQRILRQATIDFYRNLLQKQAEAVRQVENSQPFCRICHESESRETFLSPCRCCGSMGVVHKSCLEHWLAESDSTCCELCGHQYLTTRIPKYSRLSSLFIWLFRQSPAEFLFDTLAFCTFTPLVLMTSYLGWNTVKGYMDGSLVLLSEEGELLSPFYTGLLTIGIVTMTVSIDTTYLFWLSMRVRYHLSNWHSWWRRNSIVRVHLPPPPRKPSTTAKAMVEEALTSVMPEIVQSSASLSNNLLCPRIRTPNTTSNYSQPNNNIK